MTHAPLPLDRICQTCGKICANPDGLTTHRKRVHGHTGTDNATPCPYKHSEDCTGYIRWYPDSRLFYGGADFGPVWACLGCRAWVGCHQGATRPKGTVADAHLREARKHAHAEFDPIWKRGYADRREAYRLLAQRLGIPADACHIGHFDLGMCARAIAACQELGPELSRRARAA